MRGIVPDTCVSIRGVEGMAQFARATPDKPAMVLGDHVRTYARPGRPCLAAWPALSAPSGVPADGTGVVAVMLPNGFEFFETAAAACRAEARFLPVNWHLKSDELAWILEDSGAQVLVAHHSLREYVDAAVERAPCVPGTRRRRRLRGRDREQPNPSTATACCHRRSSSTRRGRPGDRRASSTVA